MKKRVGNPTEKAKAIAWAIKLTSNGPVADYPCTMAKWQGAPSTTGVGLVETMIRSSKDLAKAGINWRLLQLPDSYWATGNGLPYVHLALWQKGQQPDLPGWEIPAGKWVGQYRWWLAETRGWTRQYRDWQHRCFG